MELLRLGNRVICVICVICGYHFCVIHMLTPQDPHAGEPVLRLGPRAADARLAVIAVHGRGASAEDILSLAQELHLDDVLFLAPQAAGNTWYPYSFLSPIEQNEPALTSALAKI